jgi:hypothetical protein
MTSLGGSDIRRGAGQALVCRPRMLTPAPSPSLAARPAWRHVHRGSPVGSAPPPFGGFALSSDSLVQPRHSRRAPRPTSTTEEILNRRAHASTVAPHRRLPAPVPVPLQVGAVLRLRPPRPDPGGPRQPSAARTSGAPARHIVTRMRAQRAESATLCETSECGTIRSEPPAGGSGSRNPHSQAGGASAIGQGPANPGASARPLALRPSAPSAPRHPPLARLSGRT